MTTHDSDKPPVRSNPSCLHADPTLSDKEIETACDQACQAIAPAWPLDRSIAVNPHWSRIGMPVRKVAARMAVLAGIRVFPSRVDQSHAWKEGRISAHDLEDALHQLPLAHEAGLTPRHCIDALKSNTPLEQLPLLIDVLDNDAHRRTRLSWRQAITHQVSQVCAAYFDKYQSDWHPERKKGLYAFWRDSLQHDHGIGVLMGLPHIGKTVDALPATSKEAEHWVIQRLGLPNAVWKDYLEAVLLTVNGWASWCAYLAWQAALEGQQDSHLRELLAARLAWGVLLLEYKKEATTSEAFMTLREAWNNAPCLLKKAEQALLIDEVWQVALEIGYQRNLAQRLLQKGNSNDSRRKIDVQTAFCIDVRSEPLRRSLEAINPHIQTLGFAGFFGLPIAYTPLGTQARRPQLPGLMAPTMEVTDCIVHANSSVSEVDATAQSSTVISNRHTRFALADQWHRTSSWPGTAFLFVEAAGLGYLGGLMRSFLPEGQKRNKDDLTGISGQYRAICRPQLINLTIQQKIELSARILHVMGLDQYFAPLVVFVGHGSQSSNNAQAAALDCGACCGQTGEVNARSLAQLLNNPEVRKGLCAKGILVPESTVFAAALHNTTTDEIEGLDLDLLPEAASVHWKKLQAAFLKASDRVRRERAPSLQLDPCDSSEKLLKQLRRRASDSAQTRPEWGLAGNAAFVIAPRNRTHGAVLAGRSFLHEYYADQDTNGTVLELLMTAPMLVTHWINWQYHASTCDPLRLGSGNKILHNVVGGHIGVFEGNGGDLRIGLSHQSLHNGKCFIHEPLRMTVIIDAPQTAINTVINKHATIKQLVENNWLHLWRFAQSGFERYGNGAWEPLPFMSLTA